MTRLGTPNSRQLFEYLYNQLVDVTHPLVLVLDRERRLIAWDGDPSRYGIGPLRTGIGMDSMLPFLIGTLDEPFLEPLVLPFLSISNSDSAHIHLVPLGDQWGILFLDAFKEHERRSRDQQHSHEMDLLQHHQQKLMKELQHAQSSLKQKNRELDDANQTKSRFIASMSHEFRTPLTSVLGYSDLLRDAAPFSPKAHSYINSIERGAQNLLVMVDNLLGQARLEAGVLEVCLVPTDVVKIMTDLTDLLSPLTQKKGLKLNLTINPSKLPDLMLDGLHLLQILNNLAGNAVKYTAEGEIDIRVEWTEMMLEISVIDTGPGIPEEAKARIFEPFQRSLVKTIPWQKGAGLGLTISRQLAEQMWGDLTLASSSKNGSCFILRIPASPALTTSARTNSIAGKSILIAEDDPDIQALIKLYLEASGYQLHFCENGEEVLKNVYDINPDLILLDLNMPVMDGCTAARKLRTRRFNQPIIALTAASSNEMRDEAMAAGCDGYLQKPFNVKQLRTTISNLLLRKSDHENSGRDSRREGTVSTTQRELH